MSGAPLFRLAYISTAAYLPPPEDLDNILSVSRQNNAADDITGLLLYHEGSFFQILEGPEDAVRACYKRIGDDPRHKGCITLIAEATASRRFGGWDMAYVPYSDMNADCRRGFLNLQGFRDTAKMREVETEPDTSAFVDNFLAMFRDL